LYNIKFTVFPQHSSPMHPHTSIKSGSNGSWLSSFVPLHTRKLKTVSSSAKQAHILTIQGPASLWE